MALDARHHLFYQDARPRKVWKVANTEGKVFILKLYEVTDGTNAVKSGYYFESFHAEDGEEFDADGPESGTEWAYVESGVDSFLNHYKDVEVLKEA